MANQGFNVGPNATPGGAPEDPRVNNSALNAELKQAQLLQSQTIKSLTDTIEELQKQYSELINQNKELSTEEITVSEELQDKIQTLSKILKSMQESVARGDQVKSLAAIGTKERIATFDKLTAAIKQYQNSNLEFMKTSQGKVLDFDRWYSNFLEQQKLEIANLEASEDNVLLLEDIKKTLRKSSTQISKVNDNELNEIAIKTLKLSVEQKKRDLLFYEQNQDIIKLNKTANAQEQENVKKIISSNNFDPTKPILEHGFKSISKDMDKLIKNTKHRSLLKIVSDLLGPLGPVIVTLIKVAFIPLLLGLGFLVGFLQAEYMKLRRLGNLLNFKKFKDSIDKGETVLISSFNKIKDMLSGFNKILEANLPSFAKKFKSINSFFSKLSTVFSTKSLNKLSVGFTEFLLDIQEVFFKLRNKTKGLARIGEAITESRFFKVISSIGGNIIKGLDAISDFFVGSKGIFSPLMRFFGSGQGKMLRLVDAVTFGIGKFFTIGKSIGKAVAGVLGPLGSVISVLTGVPSLWKKLTSGDMKTAIKGILALILQITGLVFANLLPGVGAVAASLLLSFENIYKWFEPIFDLIIDIGTTIIDLIKSAWTDFVGPAIESITGILTMVVDVIFSLLRPVINLLKVAWKVISTILAPILKAVFKIMGFLFKRMFIGFKAIYDFIEPALSWIVKKSDEVLGAVLEYLDYVGKFWSDLFDGLLNSSLVKTIAGWLGIDLSSNKKSDQTPITSEPTQAIEKTIAEKAKDKLNLGKDFALDIGDSIKDGVSDGFSMMGEASTAVGGMAGDIWEDLLSSFKELTERIKENTSAFQNSPLVQKVGEMAKDGMNAAFTPLNSSDMSYAASKGAKMLSGAGSAIGKAGNTIVNNVVNNNTGSGGGTNFIPLFSSGHMDPTKIALQISYRPPG